MTNKPGMVKCDRCDGSGEVINDLSAGLHKWMPLIMCRKCQGEGELDWVENIVGKKRIFVDVKKHRPVGQPMKERYHINYERRIIEWDDKNEI